MIDVSEVDVLSDPGAVNAALADGWVLLSAAQDPHGQPYFVVGRTPPPMRWVVRLEDERPPGFLRLRNALERLGSGEAFVAPFALVGISHPLKDELIARMDFARDTLTQGDTP